MTRRRVEIGDLAMDGAGAMENDCGSTEEAEHEAVSVRGFDERETFLNELVAHPVRASCGGASYPNTFEWLNPCRR